MSEGAEGDDFGQTSPKSGRHPESCRMPSLPQDAVGSPTARHRPLGYPARHQPCSWKPGPGLRARVKNSQHSGFCLRARVENYSRKTGSGPNTSSGNRLSGSPGNPGPVPSFLSSSRARVEFRHFLHFLDFLAQPGPRRPGIPAFFFFLQPVFPSPSGITRAVQTG